jgi:hypothetical protein
MTEAFCGCRGPVVDNLVPLLEARRAHELIKLVTHGGGIVLQVAAET